MKWALLSSSFLVLFAAAGARAAPRCLQEDNPCDPDKMCTFKAALAEKALIYQIYLRNSQVTKKSGRRDGVRYDGALYNQSMTEAQQSFPNDSPAQQKEKAGQIFQDKVKQQAQQDFRMPVCRLEGSADLSLLPKPGYGGMFTNTACQARTNFEGGDYDADGFGKNDATSCPEFYERDRAHEVIHQRRCAADAKRGSRDRYNIDVMIEEEIAAYAHSVKLTKAYLRLLTFQCSAAANPQGMRTRARDIESLLTPYQSQGG